MEKTYKVTIRDDKFSPFFGFYLGAEEKQMTMKAIQDELRKISNWIVSEFRWSDYDQHFSHLVYAYQQGDEYTIYPHGYLLPDEQFEKNVASQQGTGLLFDRVWAYHKN